MLRAITKKQAFPATGSFTNDLKTEGTKARVFFERYFPNLGLVRATLRSAVAGAETLEPAEKDGYPWGTVGVAIDYRLRFSFPVAASLPARWDNWAANPEMPFALIVRDTDLPRPLVAEYGASEAVSGRRDSAWLKAAGPFFGELGLFLRNAQPHEGKLDTCTEERLCRFCFVLALYDDIARSRGAWSGTPLLSLHPGAATDDLLALCPPAAAADLAAMAEAFQGSQSQLLKGKAALNPWFSGGEGDLIVDDCYIDFKAARDPKRPSPSQWPRKLLGYVLLDTKDRYGIRTVGLYLARQYQLVTWSLQDLTKMLTPDGQQRMSLVEARSELSHWLGLPRA